ncbi:IAA-alanine resistance protein 1, partial [Trifolium pratense]
MALSSSRRKRVELLLPILCLLICFFLDLVTAHQDHSHSTSNIHHHHCDGEHDHHHDHGHDHHDHDHVHQSKKLLPEELAEEEDMKLYGFGLPHHDHHHTGALVECIGLFISGEHGFPDLPDYPAFQGKPSKTVVDSLALFGVRFPQAPFFGFIIAGAMLGDAFLHQLPHAFGGGEHSHSHGDHADHDHDHNASSGHGHSHSLADLSTGMSIL